MDRGWIIVLGFNGNRRLRKRNQSKNALPPNPPRDRAIQSQLKKPESFKPENSETRPPSNRALSTSPLRRPPHHHLPRRIRPPHPPRLSGRHKGPRPGANPRPQMRHKKTNVSTTPSITTRRISRSFNFTRFFIGYINGLVWPYIAAVHMGRAEAANELAILAQGNDRNKKIIVEENGIPPLLKMLKESVNLDAQSAAASALCNLADDVGRVRMITDALGVQVVAKALSEAPMRFKVTLVNLVSRM
ncbi:hypothetical protein Salat_1478300 [Sesamum alatum]|uniref:Uncharacterized protein n=1 Tax=Sesamum alatum TaxID=300844 RepID=A0AAE1YBQ3_9LAMI|nr:hypothetical protein Salat_1478300 [Sesamum alatum]